METGAGFRIFRRPDHRLVVATTGADGKQVETPVRASSCFPWSLPDQFVSLADDKGREVLMVEDLAGLEPAERDLLAGEIGLKNFVPRIGRIRSIRREIELFHWSVSTSAGPRSFLTHRHEAPRSLHGGKVLIRDINSDLYLIDDIKALDPKSLKLLWMYLD
jgi:hypothetical protein